MKRIFYTLATSFALIFALQAANAQVIPFQGRILQGGEPLNGEVNLVFSIEAAAWTETHTGVSVQDGLYSVALGSVDSIPQDLFYGVESHSLAISLDGTDLTPVTIYPSFTNNSFVHEVSADSASSTAFYSEVKGVGNTDFSYYGGQSLAAVENGSNVGFYIEASGPNNNTGLFAYAKNGRSINNQTEITNPDVYGLGQLSSLYGNTNAGGRAMQAQYTAEGPGHGIGLTGYAGGGGMNWGVWGRARSATDSLQVAGQFEAYGDGIGEHYAVKGYAYAPNSSRNIGIYGNANGSAGENWAGWFDGDVKITGNLVVDGEIPLTELPSDYYQIGGGVSEWKTFDLGNGVAAQLNFFGGLDSLGNTITGGGSIGIKGWEAHAPYNGYVHVNGAEERIITLEAMTDSTANWGEMVLNHNNGKKLVANSNEFEMHDPNGKLNLRLGSYDEYTGNIWTYDSLGIEAANIQSRNTGGRILLTNRDETGNPRSAFYGVTNESNSYLWMYGENPTQDGSVFMSEMYTTANDPGGNPYSNGYRRAGVDFYDNEGTRLAALGSGRDENGSDPDGKSGLLFLWGTNSPNVELTGKRWENADLPMLQLFGNQPDSINSWYHGHAVLEVQTDGSNEWGALALNGNNGAEGISMSGSDGSINTVGSITAQTIVETSDRRLKKNIVPLEHALEKTLALQGVSFNWIDENAPRGVKIGLVAQDVESVFPEFVYTAEDGTKAVNYSQMTAVLIESVKALNAKVEKLEKQNSALQQELLSGQQLREEMKVLRTMLLELAGNDSNALDDNAYETTGTVLTGQILNQ